MSKADLFKLAQGFTLMMEFMNICENAYRAWRWSDKDILIDIKKDSFLHVFLKQLAFSLAKVELSVWSNS